MKRTVGWPSPSKPAVRTWIGGDSRGEQRPAQGPVSGPTHTSSNSRNASAWLTGATREAGRSRLEGPSQQNPGYAMPRTNEWSREIVGPGAGRIEQDLPFRPGVLYRVSVDRLPWDPSRTSCGVRAERTKESRAFGAQSEGRHAKTRRGSCAGGGRRPRRARCARRERRPRLGRAQAGRHARQQHVAEGREPPAPRGPQALREERVRQQDRQLAGGALQLAGGLPRRDEAERRPLHA